MSWTNGRVWMCVCMLLLSAQTGAAQGVTRTVAAGGDLQAALDGAGPGDTILLPAGATFTGNFVLRAKSGDTFITLRTADDPRQPGPGVRATAAHAAAFATLQSPNSSSALRTEAGAHHWRIERLQFGPNDKGYGDIIEIGDGSSAQNSLTLVPYTFVLDRLYIHGDALVGQKRGIAINARDVTIINSTIRDIKGVGQDTQAIGGYNGPGPYWIENNYLEAAGENFILGGNDPYISGLIGGNVTFRRNYVSRPVSWRDPIVPAPLNVAAVASDGPLAAGTYTYNIIARRPAGQTTIAQSLPTPVTVALGVPGSVRVTWTPVPNATEYRVYRTLGTSTMYWTVTQPAFTDAGAAGTAASVPTSATKWLVKNIFELKNARDVLVEQNVFENNWENGQPGYGIVLTVRNSNGSCTWCTIQNVEFRYNIVRHTGGGFNILGYDDPSRPSVQASNLRIHDNVLYDVNKTTWGGSGFFVLIGDEPRDVTFDHNTIDHNGSAVVSVYGGTTTDPREIYGFVYTNNLSKHGSYGFFASGMTWGLPSITAYFPDGVVTANVLAGGSASKYPAGNLFPTVATHMAQFVSPSTGDFSLVSGSMYERAGLDGRDLGADIAQVNAGTAIALSGNANEGVQAVHIDTTSLPVAVVAVPFTASIQAGGGSGGYTWTCTGTLPAGVAFNPADGSIGGTPLEYGAWPFGVTVTDASDRTNTATQAYTLNVRPTQVQIVSALTASMTMGVSGAIGLQASGGTGVYRWRLVSGTLPPGVTLDEQSGTIFGTPTALGSFTVTVAVADAAYPDNVAQAVEGITVVAAPVRITTTSLATGIQGSAYSELVTATGGAGSLVWSIVSGALPAGLTLEAQTGIISGTPTTAGSSTVTIGAADSLDPANAASSSFTLTINAAQLTIVTASLPDARRTIYYSTQLQAAGGIGGYTWGLAAGTLPPGITLAADGMLSGKSGYNGYWTFTVEVRDSVNNTATRQYTLMVRTKNGAKP